MRSEELVLVFSYIGPSVSVFSKAKVFMEISSILNLLVICGEDLIGF